MQLTRSEAIPTQLGRARESTCMWAETACSILPATGADHEDKNIALHIAEPSYIYPMWASHFMVCSA